MKKRILFAFFFALCLASLFAQGTIIGKVLDKANNVPLPGAEVVIVGTQMGALTDEEGNYLISDVPAGKYSVSVAYVSFKTLTVDAVDVIKDQIMVLDINMVSENISTNAVVITGSASKQSVSSIITMQKQSTLIMTGISMEDIKRTPDRSTSDVLKRVSGTTIQDNKFVIIRGLADRYNMALLNGMVLPSTEPDRRAFSFDIFPASFMDNLIIYKTASPDLPGEFAGGIIRVNTQEIPEERKASISIGGSYNTQSTFKSYKRAFNGATDWLGIDDGSRTLSSDFPSSQVYDSLLTNIDTRFTASKQLPSQWSIYPKTGMPLTSNFQASLGNSFKIGEEQRIGFIGALTYNNINRRIYGERFSTLTLTDTAVSESYKDTTYRQNILWGALLNFAYRINENNKILFNNLYSINSNNNFVDRGGINVSNDQITHANYMQFVSNQILSNQLMGEHSTAKDVFKVNWGSSYSLTNQSYPNFRKMLYSKNLTPQGNLSDSVYTAQVPFGSASPDYAGRFDSKLQEKMWNMNVDLTYKYKLFKQEKNSLKFGFAAQSKDRVFDARIIGYVVASPSQFNYNLLTLPQDSLFTQNHININGFRVDETTNPNDSYTGQSRMWATYGMIDQKLGKKLRVVGGLRVEHFTQGISTYTFSRDSIISFSKEYWDFLPSANVSYSLGEKSALRFAASRTVSRPNLRELAPFSFYDPVNTTALQGNDTLIRTQITNLDLRYEIFPGLNQLFAVSAFYKHFKNPIEQRLDGASGAGSLGYTFFNAPEAMNFGAELEARVKPTFLRYVVDWKQWENFTLYGNFAYIQSRLNVTDTSYRQLQGQSPYVANAGLGYNNPDNGLGFNLSFNRIGRRIWLVGDEEAGATKRYYNIYENPRSVLDAQVSKRIFKNGEIKFNANDILNQWLVFYEDRNSNGKFDQDGGDVKRIATRFGSNYSLSFTYKF